MRALAELAMKGRKEAAFVAVIAALLPLLFWVSAATVALVTLRRGIEQGAGILVWAVLPAGVWAYNGDPTPLIVITGTYVLAVILRQMVDWSKTLLAAIVVGATASFAIDAALGSFLDQIAQDIIKYLQQQSSTETGQLPGNDLVKQGILGGLTLVHTLVMVLSLMLGRYWQAVLYNPGGFQQEFHQLKLPAAITLGLLVVLIIGVQFGAQFVPWVLLLLLPWIIAGAALVHGSVAKRDLGKPWLIVFYLSAFMMGHYVITLLVFAAVIDSFVDIRRRIPAKK